MLHFPRNINTTTLTNDNPIMYPDILDKTASGDPRTFPKSILAGIWATRNVRLVPPLFSELVAPLSASTVPSSSAVHLDGETIADIYCGYGGGFDSMGMAEVLYS
jgi:hypothetical protein